MSVELEGKNNCKKDDDFYTEVAKETSVIILSIACINTKKCSLQQENVLQQVPLLISDGSVYLSL